MNLRSGREFAIPQSFIHSISHLDDPVSVVALNRELECRSDRIAPLRRTVIELPLRAEIEAEDAPRQGLPAQVVNIRIDAERERRFAKRTSMVLLAFAAIVIVILGIAANSQALHAL